MNKNRDNELARYLAGEMSMNEEITFRKNLESDPRQLNDLHVMEQTWKHFDKAGRRDYSDSMAAWNILRNRLEKDGLIEPSPTRLTGNRFLPYLRIAAAILLIISVGIPAVYFGFIRNNGQNMEISQLAEAGVRTVDLPDGSRVFLNEGASIQYPSNFIHERNIHLHGEAFFEVMSDPMNPFTVRSGKVMVTVLGTSFNVKSLARSEDVEVFVQSGEVRMSMEPLHSHITLKPGEVGKSSREELTRENLKDPNYLSWKTKEFKFVETDLTEVLRELEESYHVRIHSETAELSDMKITTSYSEQSIDAILETIGTAFGLTVSLREDGYYLSN
jgi:ferric-dicitrate binding protein FerR (iron transport regulator)